MLSNQHFYHRITRKIVVGFGTMFNNIRMVRYNKAGTTEIERITVPLSYAPKEKFYARLAQDPNLSQNVQLVLPRMSFELNSITYDPLRKISSHIDNFDIDSNGIVKRVKATPYNFDFTLNIYVRNTEDGTQIVEQILPYFSPDYTLTIDLIGLNNLKVDVPIILNSVSYDLSNDTGAPEDTRVIIWTLSFTAKAYLYGLVTGSSASDVIRKAIANTHLLNTNNTDDRELNFSTGTGNFKIDELVYEGRSLETANTSAFVRSWNPTANQLVVYDSTGVFEVGRKIKGAVTGAAWTLSSTQIYSNQVVHYAVLPDPLTANANSDFGFTEIFQDYPNIGNFEVADSSLLSSDSETLTADDNNG
jgi:hypothetical protein